MDNAETDRTNSCRSTSRTTTLVDNDYDFASLLLARRALQHALHCRDDEQVCNVALMREKSIGRSDAAVMAAVIHGHDTIAIL